MKNKCCVDGCENEVRARGYCAKHYSRAKYYGKIKTEEIKHNNNIFINVLENYAVMLVKNKNVIIDIEDVEKVRNNRWWLSGKKHIYVRCKKDGKSVLLHRLIMDVVDKDTKKIHIDHINGNTLDNRKCNLRIVTPQQNAMNKNKTEYGKNSHNGVHYLKRNKKWRAYITFSGEWIHLGLFETEEEAIKVRIEAEKKYFKEYRRKE